MEFRIYGVCDSVVIIHSPGKQPAETGITFPLLAGISIIRSEIFSMGTTATSSVTITAEYDQRLLDMLDPPPLLHQAKIVDDNGSILLLGEIFQIQEDNYETITFQVDGQ